MPDNAESPGFQSKTIMERLRNETASYHAILESLPYFQTLIDHNLPLECYAGQLRALAIIHSTMEHEMAVSKDVRVLSVWNHRLEKLPLLEQDLAYFEPRVLADSILPIEAALAMASRIRIRQAENPVTLLGYLYVFEGSTLGNSIHVSDIKAAFHLDGPDGCRYYLSYQDQVQDRWKQFTETMNRVLDDPSLHDPVIDAAGEAFDGLKKLYQTLYPLSEKEKIFHVTQINPEAGSHPIPDDFREVQAALTASDRCRTQFPYYGLRYGKRGRRFSSSDTCWLVTLTDLDWESMLKQVDWLGKVLAARGMPRLMLEHTLRILHEELVRVIPDKAAVYEKLLTAADFMTTAGETFIPETEFLSLSRMFDHAVGAEMAEQYKNTGKLLVSSVADEASGIEGAVSALMGWMTDSRRFPQEWIDAVNRTVEMARQVARRQSPVGLPGGGGIDP